MWTDTAAALKLRLNPWQSLGSVEPGPIVVSAPAQTRFTVATSGGPNEGEVPSAHNPHDLYSKGQAKAQRIKDGSGDVPAGRRITDPIKLKLCVDLRVPGLRRERNERINVGDPVIA
jgi:hypothetical protein